MADRSKLTPVRVTDRNGWLRTVYRRFVGKQGSDTATKVPAPRVADGRLPSVRRRPKAELREFAAKLGAPMAKHAYEMLLRPGGREAGSLALDMLESGAIHEEAMLRILYEAADVTSPGHLHDTLRIAQRLGGSADETSLLGVRRGVVGFRRDQFGPAAITTEHELDVAAAVVGFTVRLTDEDAPLGTLTTTKTRGPLSGLGIAYGGLDHLLRERPEDADRIADYAIAYGPVKDHEDMLPLMAWLDEGIDPNLGDGWL